MKCLVMKRDLFYHCDNPFISLFMSERDLSRPIEYGNHARRGGGGARDGRGRLRRPHPLPNVLIAVFNCQSAFRCIYGTRIPRPRSLPLSKSWMASLAASSGYIAVCSSTLPWAVRVISSARSLYVPTRLPIKLISVEIMSIVGMLSLPP